MIKKNTESVVEILRRIEEKIDALGVVKKAKQPKEKRVRKRIVIDEVLAAFKAYAKPETDYHALELHRALNESGLLPVKVSYESILKLLNKLALSKDIVRTKTSVFRLAE